MPLELYLLRHAQSADKQNGQSDKDRRLTPAGVAEAVAVGNYLKEKLLIPDLILSSSAYRAKTTSERLCETAGIISLKIVSMDDLYETSPTNLYHAVTRCGKEINRLMIVGHNPTISTFMNQLCIEQTGGLYPAELAILKFDFADWSYLRKDKAISLQRFHPTV